MRRAFSLVEVVIAVGIFATAVAVVLGLLPALVGQTSSASESLVAQRLPDPLRLELQRLAASGGFDALASRAPIAATPLNGGLAFVASRDGARLHALDYLPPTMAEALAEDEQFFLIEVWRFPSGPLAYDPAGAVLPLTVRVSWPYRAPGSVVVVAAASRSQLTFNTSLLR